LFALAVDGGRMRSTVLRRLERRAAPQPVKTSVKCFDLTGWEPLRLCCRR
jgi:hypothetical protein